MVVLEVYTKAIKVKYKTTLLSKGTLFYVLTGVMSVVLPYILAYESGGFWKKWDVIHEQPKINLRGEFLFVLSTEDPNAPIICSTFDFFRKNFDHLNSCTEFLLREIDNNYDGKPDKLDFSVKINLRGNKITSLFVLLPINYTLNTCPLVMQSAIIFQHYLYDTLSHFHLMADLKLRQSSATFCYTRFLNELYDYPVMDNVFQESEYFEPEFILGRYLQRNISTHLTNIYTSIKQEFEHKDEISLKLTIQYPEHELYFQPGFWQILKLAWIQYLSIFICVLWLTDKLKNYIFQNRLVLFYEDSPLTKNAFSSN